MKALAALRPYGQIMRLHKPIGIFLLLWPTVWALLLASQGLPERKIAFIFILGVVVMRSAGCVMNDMADRHVDGQVKRTALRPLVTGALRLRQAQLLLLLLLSAAALLVVQLSQMTQLLALPALGLALLYPFMKRYTHWPQLVLGAAFNCSILMVFAELQQLSTKVLLLFFTGVLWTLVYDTIYAMVDRDDDIQLGIKSTAILFANREVFIVTALHGVALLAWCVIGWQFQLNAYYYLLLPMAAGNVYWQWWQIKDRQREGCFRAFNGNNYYGLFISLALFCGLQH